MLLFGLQADCPPLLRPFRELENLDVVFQTEESIVHVVYHAMFPRTRYPVSNAISMTPWPAPFQLPPIRHPPITAAISPLYQKPFSSSSVANNAGKFARAAKHGWAASILGRIMQMVKRRLIMQTSSS